MAETGSRVPGTFCCWPGSEIKSLVLTKLHNNTGITVCGNICCSQYQSLQYDG